MNKGIFIVLACIFIFLMDSCSVNKYLKENQYLLYKQTVKGNKKISKDAVTPLFKQKPNKNILGTMPSLYAYYYGKTKLDTAKINAQKQKVVLKFQEKINKVDTTITGKKKDKNILMVGRLRERRDKKLDKQNKKLKEGNWLMRTVGDPPSYYDTSNTNYNLRQIKFYLHSKGYFLGDVIAKIDTNRKKVFETYTITEGIPYMIKDLEYVVSDTAISRLLSINNSEAAMIAGKNYDESKLSIERDRINKLLKENGYYDFTTQYIFIEVDSSLGYQKMAVRIVVRNPNNENAHPRYTINRIVFNTENIKEANVVLDSSMYNGILFIYPKNNFSKKVLSKKIRFNVGDFYAQSKVQLTQRQLASLDMYKFININFDKNKSDTLPNGLAVYIRTSSLKKFQTTEEAGMNISSVGRYPGPFGSLNFKTRNTFRGFEVFETNLRGSIMYQAGILNPTTPYLSKEFNSNLSLAFPKFFFPGKFKERLEDYSPTTKFNAGYSIVQRPEYTRGILTTSMNYLLTKGLYTTYALGLIDLNFIMTHDTSSEFSQYLQNFEKKGNNLIYSFKNSIVSDINASYTFNNNQVGVNKQSRYVKLYLESGGTTLNFFPKVIERLKERKFTTFKYYKINTDFRFYYSVGKKNTLATRYNIGYAHSYDKLGALPYERYFFMGGTNSMRAWKPRRLGPGTFISPDPDSAKGRNYTTYKFEQPGDMMAEINLEYRFKIISFLEGAAFVDAGNLWALRPSASRPGAEFKLNKFYKQFAVGAGLGIRLNFSFLILRIDFAKKVLDPAIIPEQPKKSNFVLFENSPLKNTQMNIGIGYPF